MHIIKPEEVKACKLKKHVLHYRPSCCHLRPNQTWFHISLALNFVIRSWMGTDGDVFWQRQFCRRYPDGTTVQESIPALVLGSPLVAWSGAGIRAAPRVRGCRALLSLLCSSPWVWQSPLLFLESITNPVAVYITGFNFFPPYFWIISHAKIVTYGYASIFIPPCL